MLNFLHSFFNLQDYTQVLRNDILCIGSVVLVLGFELISTWLILFDRVKNTDTSPTNNTGSTEDNTKPPLQLTRFREFLDVALSFLFVVFITAIVLLFPFAYEHSWHGWLLLISFVLGCLFYRREIREYQLHLQLPQSPTTVEVSLLVVISIISSILIIYRWREVPFALHRDIATICLSGVSMWNNHGHPFIFNGAGLPGLLDPIYGGCILLSSDPIFGVKIYPLFCASLCPIILYRWICLIGNKPLAWIVVYIMIVSPFFQFYSRVPMGVTLWLMELIFFYGITRSLMLRGIMGPLMAGISLALVQYDYYAARALILVAFVAPFAVFPFHKRLAKGWGYRLLFIMILGFLSLYLMTVLTVNYKSSDYGIALTPKYYDKNIANDSNAIFIKISGILRMWFDSKENAVNPLTFPSSPVLLGPFAGLLIVGAGLLLLSFFDIPLFLLGATFLISACCSLFSDRSPNGHRIMIAMLPVFLTVGYGISILWGKTDGSNHSMMKFRRAIVVILLLWGGTASLMHFHYDMWRDDRILHPQEYDMYSRALRVREKLKNCNVAITSPGYAQITFLTGMRDFKFLNYGNWIKPNWRMERDLAVEVSANVRPLIGLPKSLATQLQFTEFKTPRGTHCGWEYLCSDKLFLGDLAVAQQWFEEGQISGTLMFPKSGKLQITSKDCRVALQTPFASIPSESSDTYDVLRGLNTVSLFPTKEGQCEPTYLHLRYTPFNGSETDHLIAPSQLYKIPSGGWLQEIYNGTPPNINSENPFLSSIIPTIYTFNLPDDSLKPIEHGGKTRYRSYATLPAGDHQFSFRTNEPCSVTMKIGDREMKWEGPIGGELAYFSLNADEVRGKMIEIIKTDTAKIVDISLEVIYPGGGREVPPYSWFSPYPGPTP